MRIGVWKGCAFNRSAFLNAVFAHADIMMLHPET